MGIIYKYCHLKNWVIVVLNEFLMKKSGQREKHRALNTDLGLEIGAIIQYMHHHVMAKVWKASDNARAQVSCFCKSSTSPFLFNI